MIVLTGSMGYLGGHFFKTISATESAADIEATILFDVGEACTYDLFKELWSEVESEPAPQVVVHAGAIATFDAPFNQYIDLNIKATEQICKTAKKWKRPILFISSCAARNHKSMYGWSKYICEQYVKNAGVPYIILRPFNIWGDEENRSHPSIIERIRTGTLERVFHDCYRDFVHVSDVVRSMRQAVRTLANKERVHKTYEVGTGKISWVVDLYREAKQKGLIGKIPDVPSGEYCVDGYESWLQAGDNSDMDIYMPANYRKVEL